MGARLLEREALRQIGEDGFYGELSSYYHAYTLELYLLALITARRTGHPLAPHVSARVAGLAETLAAFARPDGSLPLLADDDGGCAFTLSGLDYYDARDLLSLAAVTLDRADLLREAAVDRATWIFGSAAVHDLARRAAPAPRIDDDRQRAWRDAGYVLQSMNGAHGSARLLFDGGGMGIAGAGHAHADALQILLDVGGRPVLVDPGTSVYNRAPEWRGYFRGTRAHNTVSVDGADQSVSWGTFAWGRVAGVHLDAPAAGPGWQLARAAHDGYQRLAGSVRHDRAVLAIAPDYWLIADLLTGAGDHRFVWHYQFAADMAVAFEDDGDVTRASASDGVVRAGLTLASSAPARARLVAGETAPLRGWVSSGYGERRPAPMLEAAVTAPAPVAGLTILRPAGAPLVIDVERRAGAVIARLTRGDVVDTAIVNGTGRPLVHGDVELDGELLWLRRAREGGAVLRFVASGARQVRVGAFVRTGSGLVSFEQ